MADPRQVALLREGIDIWNRWTAKGSAALDLREADLFGLDLRAANLCGANLSRADLRQANLRGADINCANLRWTDLRRATCSKANLSGVDLRDADLSGTTLRGASLIKSKFGGTILADTDLTGAEGLESCVHLGPSTVGIDTVFKSGGSIPGTFLDGCGLPEQFITYARSLAVRPIEFYSCFISYSSQDQAFAERLYADMRMRNLRCWFAPEDLKIGDRFQESIEESIQLFDKVMIVLSEASVKSRWVEREVNAALEREQREGRTVLFPIRIDKAVVSTMQHWAADIRRTRHIGDFTAWESHSEYLKALERLLRDLDASELA